MKMNLFERFAAYSDSDYVYITCVYVVCRPTSLAWEVRKSSPGKSLSSSAIVPSAVVSRSLTFGSTSQPATAQTVNRSIQYNTMGHFIFR